MPESRVRRKNKVGIAQTSIHSLRVPKKRLYREEELGALAKSFREHASKTKEEAANELGVKRPSVQLAEENPEQSLFKLRKRMIEHYSPYRLIGPVYFLERK